MADLSDLDWRHILETIHSNHDGRAYLRDVARRNMLESDPTSDKWLVAKQMIDLCDKYDSPHVS